MVATGLLALPALGIPARVELFPIFKLIVLIGVSLTYLPFYFNFFSSMPGLRCSGLVSPVTRSSPYLPRPLQPAAWFVSFFYGFPCPPCFFFCQTPLSPQLYELNLRNYCPWPFFFFPLNFCTSFFPERRLPLPCRLILLDDRISVFSTPLWFFSPFQTEPLIGFFLDSFSRFPMRSPFICLTLFRKMYFIFHCGSERLFLVHLPYPPPLPFKALVQFACVFLSLLWLHPQPPPTAVFPQFSLT